MVETWEDDPERLDEVRARRQLLRELSRKYGEGPAGVLAFAEEARPRAGGARVGRGARRRARRRSSRRPRPSVAAAEAEVGAGAAPGGARRSPRAVEDRLRTLAMPRARFEVTVAEPDPGDDVTFLLGANPGEAVLPLAKVASGGELARAMLALRLVLTDAPPTMVFDEVDAGIGGEAALAVGQRPGRGGRPAPGPRRHPPGPGGRVRRPQLGVRKEVTEGRTVAQAAALEGDDRVVELARMLSGQPGSATARRHAEELLGVQAATARHAPTRRGR